MTLLQIDSTLVSETSVQAAEAAKGVIKGDFSAVSNLIDKLTTLGVEAGKALLAALFIYIVGRFVIRLINNFLARLLEKRKVDAGIQGFLKSLVNILLTVLLFITVVSALGINTTSFAALLASIGLAFGMALSGNLQNFAGGLMVLLLKPFRVGDYIEAQGTAGTVAEIQIFHTVITTPDNKRIYLPNGALSSGSVTNYSTEIRRVEFIVGVEYDTDADLVKKTLLEIMNKNEKVVKHDPDHAPFVALGKLNNSSVDFTARAWVKGTDYWPAFFEIQETIYTEFNRQNIGFPFPQVTVHQGK